jgi:hypothetical protein
VAAPGSRTSGHAGTLLALMHRLVLGLTTLTLALTACGAGPDATAIGDTELVCTETFCAEIPADWNVVDSGDDYVSYAHPLDSGALLATVGPVNMEGLVTANGGTWPQTVAGVVEVFWEAADGGNADLGSLTVLPDGSVESFGVFGDGRMWTRLIPITTSRAVGVEMRAPNSSWEPHAEVLLDSVTLLP